MGDLFFFIKMLVYTFVLCLVLQARIAGVSLEERLKNITHRSELASEARLVAEGALRFIGAKTPLPSRDKIYEELPAASSKIQERMKGHLQKNRKALIRKIQSYSENDRKEP